MLITKLSRAETQAWRQALIGPIKIENMFYLEPIIYTYWALLCSFAVMPGGSSNFLPPAKPRTLVLISFSGPMAQLVLAAPGQQVGHIAVVHLTLWLTCVYAICQT